MAVCHDHGSPARTLLSDRGDETDGKTRDLALLVFMQVRMYMTNASSALDSSGPPGILSATSHGHEEKLLD